MAQTIPELLREFEMSLAASNPDLLNSLRRGAPEAKLRKKLSSANVEGNVDPVVSLFSWRDGTNFDQGNSLEKSSPFPESTYIFMDFSMMLAHFQGFNEAAVYHPRFKDIVGRYFPVFWDGSDNWIAIDISPTGNGRVVFLITQSENIVCEAYSSLEALILDAIRANRDATELSCFSRLSSSAAHTELCCTFCREPKSKVGSLVFSKHSASICCACLATASQLAKSKGAALELPPKPLVDVYWEQ